MSQTRLQHIALVKKADDTCWNEHCPGDQYRVHTLPGWTLVVGRRPEDAVPAAALAEIMSVLQPGESGTLVPDGTL